jgi:hypothetical protein
MVGHGLAFLALRFDGTACLYLIFCHDRSFEVALREKKATRESPCGMFSIKAPYPLPVREAMAEFAILSYAVFSGLRTVDSTRFAAHCARFSGRGAIPHRRYPVFMAGSPRALPGVRKVSRSGERPEPTVTVRMKEKTAAVHGRERFFAAP